jgi:hypothetical protein
MDVDGVRPYAEPIVHRVVDVGFPSDVPIQQVPVVGVVINDEAASDPVLEASATDDFTNNVDFGLLVRDFLASALNAP